MIKASGTRLALAFLRKIHKAAGAFNYRANAIGDVMSLLGEEDNQLLNVTTSDNLIDKGGVML